MLDVTRLVHELLDGWGMTLALIAASAPLGLLIGVVVGTARVYAPRPIRWLAAFFQSVLRGVPLVVQLFILYYLLPRAGLLLSPFVAATVGFSLCSGAYHSEYIRSALQSLDDGQMAAARSLGMTHFNAIWHVILPQATRKAVPGCGNELVYLIKYSSLSYLVTLVDLTGAGRIQANASFRFFEVFLVVGMLYLIMVAVARLVLSWLQVRWRRSSGVLENG